ncbi:hypothetical protein P7C73_g2252, partial [Tremellales sp. Uapishka_1]
MATTSPAAPVATEATQLPSPPSETAAINDSPAYQQAPPVHVHPPSNPKVTELHLMFPTVEPSVIEIVLESCGGSQDRAIETLLQMTDENFKPDELAGARHEEESQVDLDAEFARTLQLQDEQEYRERRAQPPPQPVAELPYQARVRRAPARPQQGSYDQRGAQYQQQRDQQQQYQDGQNPPGMLLVEEKLERFAEVGKQTFNTLLSKAKAKYTEYQAQQPAASGSSAQSSKWGAFGGNEEWRRAEPQPQGGSRGGEQNRGGLWGSPQGSQRSSMRSESFSSESTIDSQPIQAPLRQSSNRWQPSDSFEDPLPPARTLSANISPPRANPVSVPGGRKSPGLGVGSPEKSLSPAGKIDLAKLGILPKKRVDLLSTSPAKQTPAAPEEDPNPLLPSAELPRSLVAKIPATPPASSHPHQLGDSDDDDLEYTRNPFDE